MTQHITTLQTSDGTVTINAELFQEYLKEAFEHLTAIEEATEQFKEVVETVAATTGLKKPKVSKYLKERYEAKTKKTRELGDLFTSLDEATQ